MDRSSDLNESDIRASLQRNVGMSEYQSHVYLALVQHGKQTMKELSEASGVPKQRVYDIIEELRDREFVELNDSYPKRAYAVDPSKTIGPIQQQIEIIQNELEELHRSVTDIDSGVAQFQSRPTIKKYVSELLSSAERTVFLLTSVDRLGTFERDLSELEDVQVRIVVSGLDESDIEDGEVRLHSPIEEYADHVRGTLQTEPFVLAVDRTSGFFWPNNSNVHQRNQEGFYVTDEELAFSLDQFLSDSIWPLGYPFDADREASPPALPIQYFRIRDCLEDLQERTDQVSIDALYVIFDGIDRVSEEQVTMEGMLLGFYYSPVADRAYLEVDIREDGTTETVTVGGWNSQREDYRAERIELREHGNWESDTLDEETLAHIDACRSSLPDDLSSASVLVGFDGYIDHIRQLVGERKSPRMYDEISEFDTLREMMTRATGKDKTLQFEWVESDRLAGGHTAHVGQSLDTLGYDSRFIGYFGHPIREEFQDSFDESRMLSLGEPTVTEYLQFEDGKVLFTDSRTNQVLNWETLREYVPPDELADYLEDADLVSIGGWALITEIASIWEGIHEQVYPMVSSPPEDVLVCTSDVHRLTETTIRSDLESLQVLDDAMSVTLVTTGEQAEHLESVLTPGESGRHSLQRSAISLREEIGITRFVITSAKESVLAGEDDAYRIQSPIMTEPAEKGTFEDHFTAGIALGLGEGLEDSVSLTLGSALAGYFKQQQTTPTVAELRSFLTAYENGQET